MLGCLILHLNVQPITATGVIALWDGSSYQEGSRLQASCRKTDIRSKTIANRPARSKRACIREREMSALHISKALTFACSSRTPTVVSLDHRNLIGEKSYKVEILALTTSLPITQDGYSPLRLGTNLKSSIGASKIRMKNLSS